MVYEQSKRRCITANGWEMCYNTKTIYIREIKDKSYAEKKVTSYRTDKKDTKIRTTHKMKWVPIGTFCPVCLNIDYYPSWLETNKKENDELRERMKERKTMSLEERRKQVLGW